MKPETHTHEWTQIDQGEARCLCGISRMAASVFPYNRILITGGAGFLGRCVDQRLRQFENVARFIPRSAEYDLTEKRDASRLLDDARPNLVIHLAANCGGIGYNQKNPGALFYDNAMMGLNVVEQCRLAHVRKLVLVGTVCSYGRDAKVPFTEDSLFTELPEPTNRAYAIAKLSLLYMLHAYRQQYGLNGIYLIPINLFGVGDRFDLETSHVIPALIRKCVEAKREGKDFIEVWGSGSASREFLYISDCADAIVRAAELYNDGDPVNIGTGQEITIRDLATKIAELTGFDGEIRWQRDKPDGQPRRCLDTSRARERFGFEAKTSLEDGLRRTIEWYEQNN